MRWLTLFKLAALEAGRTEQSDEEDYEERKRSVKRQKTNSGAKATKTITISDQTQSDDESEGAWESEREDEEEEPSKKKAAPYVQLKETILTYCVDRSLCPNRRTLMGLHLKAIRPCAPQEISSPRSPLKPPLPQKLEPRPLSLKRVQRNKVFYRAPNQPPTLLPRAEAEPR